MLCARCIRLPPLFPSACLHNLRSYVCALWVVVAQRFSYCFCAMIARCSAHAALYSCSCQLLAGIVYPPLIWLAGSFKSAQVSSTWSRVFDEVSRSENVCCCFDAVDIEQVNHIIIRPFSSLNLMHNVPQHLLAHFALAFAEMFISMQKLALLLKCCVFISLITCQACTLTRNTFTSMTQCACRATCR